MGSAGRNVTVTHGSLQSETVKLREMKHDWCLGSGVNGIGREELYFESQSRSTQHSQRQLNTLRQRISHLLVGNAHKQHHETEAEMDRDIAFLLLMTSPKKLRHWMLTRDSPEAGNSVSYHANRSALDIGKRYRHS